MAVAGKPKAAQMVIKDTTDIPVINPNAEGSIPVALLSRAGFDATRSDVKTSLRFL